MIRALAASLVAALTSVAACGPANVRTVVVNQQMSVVLVNLAAAPTTATIDPNDPRIAKAGAAIAEVLGHPLRYEIDAALARRFGGGLHDKFVAAMEETLDALVASRKRSPDAFAYAGPALKTIAIDYGPSAREPAPVLSMQTGVLRVVRAPDANELLGGYDILDAFNGALEASIAARYASRAPESIPPAEQRAYFAYVAHHHYPDDLPREGYEADRLARTATLLRLYDRVGDPSLRADLRKELVDRGESLAGAMGQRDTPPAIAANGEPVRVAFVAWANARAEEWSPHDRREVSQLFFSTRRDRGEHFRQGFDAQRFARPVVLAFAHAPPAPSNHAVVYGGDDDTTRVVEEVVCPYVDERGSMSHRYGCDGTLYADVLALPDGARRLTAWILELQSDAFTQTAVLNALDAKGTVTALDVVQGLLAGEGTPRASLAALRALAEYGGWNRRDDAPKLDLDAAVARLVGWYRARPALRGPVLYALTGLGRTPEARIAWGHLAQVLGAPVSAAEYASFLDQSPHAFAVVDLVTKGLGPGWSRAGVVIPRYEKILDGGSTNNETERQGLARRLIESFCEGGTLTDVKAFQSFARARVEAYPDDRRFFNSVSQDPPAEVCGADSAAVLAAKGAGGGKGSVLFGN